MCEFCIELRQPLSARSRIIWRDDLWAAVPTLGCFVPGYTLLLPVDHTLAFAALQRTDLEEADALLGDLRSCVMARLGPTIVAEHGSTHCDTGASCCEHAHLHLIPVPDVGFVLDKYHEQGGSPIRLAGFSDLQSFGGGVYQYLSPSPGVHLVWETQGFSRQFVRRVCAAAHELGDQYDWRRFPFEANMRETLHALRRSFGHRRDSRRYDAASSF